MKGLINSLIVVGVLSAIVSVLLAGRLEYRRGQVHELQAEVAKWQQAAMPAIRARGWDAPVGRVTTLQDRVAVTEVTPQILKYALDHCYATPTGTWDDYEPGCHKSAP